MRDYIDISKASSAKISIIVDNLIDPLVPSRTIKDHTTVTRSGLVELFEYESDRLQGEMGLSLLIETMGKNGSSRLLFDAALTSQVLLHNWEALALGSLVVDQLIVSHGHPDHYGGALGFLAAQDRPGLPILTHQDALLPRYAVLGSGGVAPFYNHEFTQEAIRRAGGAPVISKSPLPLGSGALTTGEIPLLTDFENIEPDHSGCAPGLYVLNQDFELGHDEVLDEQALIVVLDTNELIIVTGCGHRGVINTVLRAKELTGLSSVRAIIGGFHLGFPTTPAANIRRTAEELSRIDADMVMPMHCSGLPAHAELSRTLPDSYVQPSVGTVVEFAT